MSSFLVSQECMNNIINGIYGNADFKRFGSGLLREQNLSDEKDFKQLGNRLFKLNQLALFERYGDDPRDTTLFEWEALRNVSNIQVLKSIQCLLYQCSEGENTERELYKWLSNLERAFMNLIINSIPEYDKARWDR